MSPTPQENEHVRRTHAARVRAAYQWTHIIVDFTAAALFVIGSVMFFYPAWERPADWCFLIGSIFFAFKPTLRFFGRLHLKRILGPVERELVQVVQEL